MTHDAPTRLRVPEADSTNEVAKSLARDPATMLPMVVRADRQTAGRGRGSNRWWSDEGSLTFSLLLDPDGLGLATERTPLTSLAAAVAVVDVVEPFARSGAAGIRWPNDVEVDDRKLAGILPERIATPDGPRLIIGVGLNVRTRLDDAPAEVAAMATTLERCAGRPLSNIDQDDVFDRLVTGLVRMLTRLAEGDGSLAERWAGRDRLRDRPVQIESGGEIIEGIARGIGADGSLRLEVAGTIREMHGGIVRRPRVN